MSYKGRHRAPSNTVPRLRRLGTVGIAATAPALLGALPAQATTPNEILEIIAKCESGNRNVNNSSGASTASGYLQIINGTWRAYGGLNYASRAIHASRAEQFIVGRNILAGQGIGAWNPSRYCWGKKIGNPPSRTQIVSEDSNRSGVVTRTPTVKKERTHSTAQKVAKSYVIKRGDTLNKIAARNGTTWRALYNLNRATVKNPNLIYAGASLRLR